MIRFLFSLIVACGIFGQLEPVVLAQSDEQTPTPREPLISRVSEMGGWTVTMKYKAAAIPTPEPSPGSQVQPVAERIVAIRGEKSGTTFHQITIFSSGAKSDLWSISGEEVCKYKADSKYVHLTTDHPLYSDFSKSEFGELSWVSMHDYKGLSEQDNKKFFYFEVKNSERKRTYAENLEIRMLASTLKLIAETKGGTQQAKEAEYKRQMDQFLRDKFGESSSKLMVDIATQLPIAYDDGTINRTYAYSQTSTTPQPPPDALLALNLWKEHAKTTIVHSSPP